MKAATQHHIYLGERRVDYRIVRSPAARQLRLRVGLNGVEVVRPAERTSEDVTAFLGSNASWILGELQRVERLRGVRRLEWTKVGEMLFRGEVTRVRVERTRTRARGNAATFANHEIIVRCGVASQTPVARSLENWLRKQARVEIERQLASVTARLRHKPERVYVMGQRTKWGNCSSQRNLSFNWRLILAPDLVLRYLVTHEAVHLAVPDHSPRFWLTVQGLCPGMEQAKAWLRTHEVQMLVDLEGVLCREVE